MIGRDARPCPAPPSATADYRPSMSAAIPTIRRRSPRCAPRPDRASGWSSARRRADQQGRLPQPALGADDRGRGGRRACASRRWCCTMPRTSSIRPSCALFDALIERFDLVQLPVRAADRPQIALDRRPLCRRIRRGARQGAGGARRRSAPACPRPASAARSAATRSAAIAAARGAPFDPDSLTEDYELGLRLRAMGRRAAFVRLPPGAGGAVGRDPRIFPGDARRRGRAEGALDDRHRAVRLGPARLERRPRRALDAAARPPVGARRLGARRRPIWRWSLWAACWPRRR